MNGEGPSVPITTLAGIQSLTDLLLELPLPTPLPGTTGTQRSLLSHGAHDAEESQRLLNGPHDNFLVPQLLDALNRTSLDHVEVKDGYCGRNAHCGQTSQLLQYLLNRNPGVFGGLIPVQTPQPSPSAANANVPQAQVAGTSNQASQPGQSTTPGSSPWMQTQFSPNAIYSQPASSSSFSASHLSSCSPHSNSPQFPTQESPSYFEQCGPQSVGGNAPAVNSNACLGNPATPGTSTTPSTSHGNIPPQPTNQLSSYSFAQVTGQPTATNLPHTPSVLVSPNSLPNNCSPQTPSSIVADDKSQYASSVLKNEEQLPQTNSQIDISVVNSISNGDCSKGSAKTFSSDESRTDTFTPIHSELPISVENFANNHNVSSTFLDEKLLKTSSENNYESKKSQSATLTEPCHRKVVNSIKDSDCNDEYLDATSISTSSITPAKRERRQSSATSGPVVVLKKLSFEEQILAQKSIKQFTKKIVHKPEDETEESSVIPKKAKTSTKNEAPERKKSTSSSSSSNKKETNYRVFTSKRKEPDKNKVKNSKRHLEPDYEDGNNTLADKVKKRRRSNQANYVESPVSGDEDYSEKESSEDSVDKIFSSKTNVQTGPIVKKAVHKKVKNEIMDNFEDLSESNTFQNFSRIVDSIFDAMEEIDLTTELDENADCPEEVLIPLYQLKELTREAAKMKMLKVTNQFSINKLNKLLIILERNVMDGSKIFPETSLDDHDEEESRIFMELALDRITRSVDASLICMYIMTSASMPEKVFLEDNIEKVVTLAKFQLQNSVYPVFDPAYRVDPKSKDGYSGSIKQKRAHANKVRHKSIIQLYNKLHEIVGLLGELLDIQTMTDTIILKMSTLGVSSFFVEGVSELQLSALRLVTSIFAGYPKHRQLILEDILASMARLPTSKRSLRNYRLNSEENIQMLTALVLQLIHSVVQLPEATEKPKPMNILGGMSEKKSSKDKNVNKTESTSNSIPDKEVLITSSYQAAISTGYRFLTVFLKKCGAKNEDMDYRPLFENFVQDLLSTLNKPEWPATEPLLSLLGSLLVQNFSNKSVDTPIRVASLEYLGVVASRLRKDAVSSQLRMESINEVIQRIVKESLDEDDAPLSTMKGKKSKHKSPKMQKRDDAQILQKALLNYLDDNMESDSTLLFARRFYIAQWYKDANSEVASTPNKSNRKKDFENCSSPPPNKSKSKHGSTKNKRNSTMNASYAENNEDDDELIEEAENDDDDNNAELMALTEERKQFLFTLIAPKCEKNNMRRAATELDYETAELVARFLSSKRSISKAFDYYVRKILKVLGESTVAVRTKAMKSLSMVVEADPSILARPEMQNGVSGSLLDPSTSVREAVIDLVGKFILIRPELTHQYYDMLTARILDTGVSVRKRVIKILKDICLEQPDFPKVPEICVKIIRRVNDEEGIKKLVGEVFQSMWFIPVPDREKERILQKVKNITHVVAACKDIGLEWFEQLLSNLLKAKEEINVKPVVKACKQIVDCLVESVLTLEESTSETAATENLAACFTTLNLFTKIQPQLVIRHAVTIQPYLSISSSNPYDYIVALSAANILQKIVPLLDHPSHDFLTQLEEALVKLILRHSHSNLMNSCVACLGTIVNNVTKNYTFIKDVFRKFFVCALGCRKICNERRTLPPGHRPNLVRALCTIGLFCVQFDFNLPPLDPEKIHDPARIFEVLHFFTLNTDNEVSLRALNGLGLFLQRYFDFMMGPEVKELYQAILTNPNALPQMKCQVLRNMSNYLSAEDARLNQKDSEWSKVGKNEDLKEMDVSAGMASTVIQIYLKQVLEAVLSKQDLVRQAALKVIQVTLSQGLVHPVQIVPYLICLGSDDDNVTRGKADQLLQDIEKKYPGFVQMKALVGVQMSFKLQQLLKPKYDSLVRGFRMAECSVSRNGFLYSVIRGTRQNRRAFVLSILKRFDEQCRTTLAEMIYLADNLVYFPYQAQDEPLFIMHHIDVMLSVTGANLLQSFREGLIPKSKNDSQTTNTAKKDVSGICENGLTEEKDISASDVPQLTDLSVPDSQRVPQAPPAVAEEDDDDDEDFETILERLPEDTKNLQDCINMSQGWVLLLFVKQTLKDMYGFTDNKIQQYSPNESAKVYEKALNRRSGVTFKPTAVIEFAQQNLNRDEKEVLNAEGKQALVNHYLNFKQLMLSIDPSDDDEDEEGGGTSVSARGSAVTADQLLRTYTGVATAINAGRSSGVKKEEVDENKSSNKVVNSTDGVVTTPFKDIVATHKSTKTPATNSRSRSKHKTPKSSSSLKEKVKKKHKKKRRRILDSDDSDDVESDPDYE